MSATVQNLHEAVAEGEQSVTRLLCRTKVISAKLNLEEVERWVNLELQGFAEDTEPPKYRRVFTTRLEVYNSYRDVWQFAGNLNYTLTARQPISEIEAFSGRDCIDFPVAKNFSIKNEFGDSFGSDWPQRFVVLGSEYKRVIGAVAARWDSELEMRGIGVSNVRKFVAFLDALSKDLAPV